MRDLRDYLESISPLIENAGAFYSFSDQKIKEQSKEAIQYISLGNGLMCPKDKAEELKQAMFDKLDESVKTDIRTNGIEAIVRRELRKSHCDMDKTVDALEMYNLDIDYICELYYEEIKSLAN